jgi:flagellar hook-associated protein 1 FlgK
MPTLTGGINTALSAILTNTHAMQVVNQNVANVNTPGYRRQMAMFRTAIPTDVQSDMYETLPGQIGNGVMIESIQRYSTNMLDNRYRAASGDKFSWQARQSVMSQMEGIFSPLDDSGLPAQMDQFWAAWGQLANNPTDMTVRHELLGQADTLAKTFNTQYNRLTQLRFDQNTGVTDQVSAVNTAAAQVAELNGEIARVFAMGEFPNSLMDQRDVLLDQLAESVGAVSYLQKDGTALVSVGGHALVTNRTAFELQTSQITDPTSPNVGMIQVQWSDGRALESSSGTLSGTLAARDEVIPAQMTWLNTLAAQLVDSVNTLHQGGFALDGTTTGQDFFAPLTAGSEAAKIQVSTTLTAEGIAASQSGEPGDNVIADQIFDLKFAENVFAGSDNTFNKFLNNQISFFAADLNRANSKVDHSDLIVQALATQRASESGVSLDEEAASLAKYERAYQAAGRLMTAFDQMLDTIINSMGLVGR